VGTSACEEGIVGDAEREFVPKARVLVFCAVPLLVPPNPLNNEGDPVVDLTSLSPSHNGFSASFTGALGVGLWEIPILDVVFGVRGSSEGGNVNTGGRDTSSGFVNANELAKKFGTFLSFTPTFATSASGAKV
jgi:hypothetical protein